MIPFLYLGTLLIAIATAGCACVALRRERTLRTRAESKLTQSEFRLNEIEALARVGNWEFDLVSDKICWSDETFRIFGLTPGTQEPDFADVLLSINPEDAPRFDRVIQEAINNREPYEVDLRISCPNGSQKHIHAQGKPVCNGQAQVVRLIGTVLDITERKRAENDLAHQAAHDALTGLVNRRYLLEQLESNISLAQRHRTALSVCLCDVDKFKKVNDTYGHAAGDEILSCFSRLLSEGTRRSDVCGRLGGDEFCIVFPQTVLADAHRCIERIRERLEAIAFETNSGQAYGVTATFGMAQLQLGMTSGGLLEAADKALYEAKRQGRNCTVAVG